MWWRAHDEALDDPKLQRLTGDLFKAWFNLMCLASRNEGRLPALADVAFGLRLTEAKAAEVVTLLERAKLLDKTETGFEPHNWASRQYLSDTSTARVKRHRDKRAAAGLEAQWWAPAKLRRKIYDRDGRRCLYCGSADRLTLDHKTPELRGGDHSEGNLQTLCLACNASKRDMTHEEFLERHPERVSRNVTGNVPETALNGSQSRTEQIRAEQKTEIRAVEPTRHAVIKTRCEELFEEVWAKIPRRDGANPRKPAFEKFRRLTSTATTFDHELAQRILDAIGRWSADEQRLGMVGTGKVAQLITWLNQARWEGYAAPAAAAEVPGFYAKFTSPEREAWDAYGRKANGKTYPQDRAGGWRFPTQWPPGHEAGNADLPDPGGPVVGSNGRALDPRDKGPEGSGPLFQEMTRAEVAERFGNDLADLDPPAKPTANGSATRFTI